MRQGRKKIVLGLICAFFLILYNGQTVLATQSNNNDISLNQPTQVNSNVASDSDYSIIGWDRVERIIKIIGGSLGAIIVALITIYNFLHAKDYDLENMEVHLINKNPIQDMSYTRFFCGEITKDKRSIEQKLSPNPYYLDMCIKVSVPSNRKNLKNIVLKKLIINMNGYRLKCLPEGKKHGGYKKCTYDKHNQVCMLLIKWPTIKQKNKRIELNPTMSFRNPEYVTVDLVWYPQSGLVSIVRFLHPQKRTVEFQKIEHENGISRIGIKSRRII